MSRVVWKQTLDLDASIQHLDMPVGAVITHVGVQPVTPRNLTEEQAQRPVVWFLCDSHAPVVTTPVQLVGTGHPLPDGDFLGTVVLFNGSLVLHLIRLTERTNPA